MAFSRSPSLMLRGIQKIMNNKLFGAIFALMAFSFVLGAAPYIPHYSLEGPEVFRRITSKEEFDSLFLSLDEYANAHGKEYRRGDAARIYIVRHGQSVANEKGINAGQSEYPISEKGILEAEGAGFVLANLIESFAGVYCTPLTRTRDSIGAISRIWHEMKGEKLLGPQQVGELIEKHCGTLENIPREDYEPYKIREKIELANLRYFRDKFSYKMVEDGEFESLADVFERASPAIAEIGQRHLGEDVLICSHVGVMRSLILGLLASLPEPVDLGVRSFDLPNAAIIVIEYDKNTNDLRVVAASRLSYTE